MALNNGKEQEDDKKESKTLRRVFDYESDREEITKQIDKNQREILMKDGADAVFVANSEILPILTKIKTLIKVNDDELEKVLNGLKEDLAAEKQENTYEFDIFGAIAQDRTKIKILGTNKHRETEKNKFQILKINDDTSLKDFKMVLKNIQSTLSDILSKSKNIIDMPIYKVTSSEKKIDLYGYSIYSINCEDELNKKEICDEYNLFKLNLLEGMPAVFFTNIIFFDNFNKTLPLGMDKSNNVLIDSARFSFELKDKKTVYSNMYFTKDIDSNKYVSKKINIYEYEVVLNGKNKNT